MLTATERETALMLRNRAAIRLLRTDPELTPYEALALVVAPPADLREASEAKARLVCAEECRRCGSVPDPDGGCPFCGEVTIGALA